MTVAVGSFPVMKVFGQFGPFQSFRGSSQSLLRSYQAWWGVPVYDLLRQCISSTYANGVFTVSDPIGSCLSAVSDGIFQENHRPRSNSRKCYCINLE